MRKLGDLIARDADRLAEVETRDTGKLLREMRGQLGSIPDWFYYFSGLADKLEGSTIPGDKPNFLVYTRREPAGVVAAIVPWNSPLLLLCWKLAPALAAGCMMVAKPSDYSPASVVELAELMTEAGFPPGFLNVVTGFGPAVGKALRRSARPRRQRSGFTISATRTPRSCKAREPVHVMSQRLGHANATITLAVYAHVMPGNQRQAADTFARLIGGGQA
jgi:(Z)-2-((N-methylformamido)methylene)-5-hydroxybutyrolactone dehydrogenase